MNAKKEGADKAAPVKGDDLDFSKLLSLDEGKRVLFDDPTVIEEHQEPRRAPKAPERATAARKAAGPAPLSDTGRKTMVQGNGGGRPTYKEPGTECVRVAVNLPLETVRMMRQALAGELFGKFTSNTELVDAAIRAFLAQGRK